MAVTWGKPEFKEVNMRLIQSRTAVVALVAAVAVLTIALGSWQGWLAQAAPDEVYVNDNLLPDVEGCNAPDANTIADGITAADPGDTVVVCEGVYEGGITVDKSVTIEGREAAAPGDVAIDVDPATPTDGLIIDHDNVTIRHLTLNGPDKNNVGIHVLGGGPPSYEGIVISDVEVTDWDESIHADDAQDMVIEYSDVHGNTVGVGVAMGTGNAVQNNTITDNDYEGLDIFAEDEFLVEGNTLSGNAANQLVIWDRVNMRILRNDIVIVAGSDGIDIHAGPAEAFIQIGGSPENANSFSGPFNAAPGDPTGDHYVELRCGAENTVDATYNYWGGAGLSRTDIAARIFNDEDDPSAECAAPNDVKGAVVFHPWATEAAPTPSPSPTPEPSPSPTVTPTPGTRTFDLQQGWNSFVWTGATGSDPATVLSCIDGSYAIAYRLVGGGWERYVPGDAVVSNMTNLNQYDSLLVLVTATGVQCQDMPVAP
jgi:parallel beta-helix repeat protein